MKNSGSSLNSQFGVHFYSSWFSSPFPLLLIDWHRLKKFLQYCSGGSGASASISALPGWAATSWVRQTKSSLLLGFWSLPSLYLFWSVWGGPFSIGMGQCLLLSVFPDWPDSSSQLSLLTPHLRSLCAVLGPPVERSSLCPISLALQYRDP